MEHSEQEEMELSSTTVRRLRAERGWSQEQLAAVSALSLRTIQRVEAEGSASLETRTSLAAAFEVPLADLAELSLDQTQASKSVPRRTFNRYKISVAVAMIALVPVALAATGVLPATLASLGAVSAIAVIALAIYAGLGWYMTGAVARRSRMRRIAQALFIYAAIFYALASGYRGGSSSLVAPALSGVLAVFIYFALDFLISRHRDPLTVARGA